MITIEFAYLIASSIAIMAMLPQVKQLLVTRQSEEFNVFSWSSWTFSQFVALMYGISLGAVPYIVINSIWLAYYLVMIGVIIYFRKPQKSAALTEFNYLQPQFDDE